MRTPGCNPGRRPEAILHIATARVRRTWKRGIWEPEKGSWSPSRSMPPRWFMYSDGSMATTLVKAPPPNTLQADLSGAEREGERGEGGDGRRKHEEGGRRQRVDGIVIACPIKREHKSLKGRACYPAGASASVMRTMSRAKQTVPPTAGERPGPKVEGCHYARAHVTIQKHMAV